MLGCVAFAIGLLASWAATVVYDSNTFADRSVAMLNEPEVRRELADRLTEQLARSGNQNAVNFRPAFQLAVEAAIDTDTFRSIFRTAVRRTHQAILVSQQGDGSALDLSDSVTIIVVEPDASELGGAGPEQLGRFEQQPRRRHPTAVRSARLELGGLRRHHHLDRRARRPALAAVAIACRPTVGGPCAASVGVSWPAVWCWPRWCRWPS